MIMLRMSVHELYLNIGPAKQILLEFNIVISCLPSINTCILGAQKNPLIRKVLLSTRFGMQMF